MATMEEWNFARQAAAEPFVHCHDLDPSCKETTTHDGRRVGECMTFYRVHLTPVDRSNWQYKVFRHDPGEDPLPVTVGFRTSEAEAEKAAHQAVVRAKEAARGAVRVPRSFDVR